MKLKRDGSIDVKTLSPEDAERRLALLEGRASMGDARIDLATFRDVMNERERCARLVETFPDTLWRHSFRKKLAEKIRSGK